MAIHQRVKENFPSDINLFLPHNGEGRLKMLLSGGETVRFHRPRGSRLSMLINGKQRVNL